METLRFILDLSQDLPLTVDLWLTNGHAAELAQLALSSHRWVAAAFEGELSALQDLSSVQGRLPLLTSLNLWSYEHSPAGLEAFAVAPQLVELQIEASPKV